MDAEMSAGLIGADSGLAEQILGETKIKTILMADDDYNLLMSLKELFEDLAYNVICHTNGQDAYKDIILKKEDVDIIIADMYMPGKTGIELAKSLLDIDSDMKIILYTGSPEEMIKKEAYKIGVTKYITKNMPVNKFIDEVLDVIQS